VQIYIRGSNQKVSKRELRFASQFFAYMLMGPRLSKAVKVTINHVKEGSLLGSASWVDDNTNPREFEININPKLSRKSYLQTLAHEMVHVKQYAKGELKTLFNKREMRWKGQYIAETDMHYFDQPWEVEAFGRELGLYLRYNKMVKAAKIDFVKPVTFDHNKLQNVKRIKSI
jgi:hypothetical protein